ncbi:MAG: tRNA lysidine(34) synthetase TilS [Burkholderiales bacterium]|nr:tRNA lysidine(34) synthetase TilS [Burkholderiales bacterium]
MAGSRKRSSTSSPAASLVEHVAAALAGMIAPGARVVLALSGGVDSVVLLDLLHRLRGRARFALCAAHVDHGLSPRSGEWASFCRRTCRRLGVPLRVVSVRVERGGGVEAGARAARYAALGRQRCDFVALAHHRDDQVETLLLQLLRGAGVKGLAAMPAVSGTPPAATRRGHGAAAVPVFIRPLLEVTREEILAYAKARGLEWVDDESNAELRFRRNYLRHRVLPVIAAQFPGYRAALARSARHLAEAAALLDDLAAADGAGAIDAGALRVEALRRLPPARARNLLRHFIARAGMDMPGAARLGEALRQALGAAKDARVAVELGERTLCRHEGRLYLVGGRTPAPLALEWRGERAVALAALGGTLHMRRMRGRGVSLARLRGRPLSIGVRRGGERLQVDSRRPRRTLKNLLQEARVPPWERERLPLLYCGHELVWAAGIGIACAYRARAGEQAVMPEWRPDDTARTLPAT